MGTALSLSLSLSLSLYIYIYPSIIYCMVNIICVVGFQYIHYSDVIMGASLKSPASPMFTQPFIQAQMKENIKAPRHWPLCAEFTGDRWIPLHKWPVARKMYPFDDVIIYALKGALTCGLSSCLHTLWWWYESYDQYCVWLYVPAIVYIFCIIGHYWKQLFQCRGIYRLGAVECCFYLYCT